MEVKGKSVAPFHEASESSSAGYPSSGLLSLRLLNVDIVIDFVSALSRSLASGKRRVHTICPYAIISFRSIVIKRGVSPQPPTRLKDERVMGPEPNGTGLTFP